MNVTPLSKWHNLFATLAVCSAAGLEIGSAWLLWNVDTSVDQTARILLPHFIACIMLAVALVMLLTTRYRATKSGASLFVFSVSFLIPWFGALGLICVLVPSLWWPKKCQEDGRRSWCYKSIPQLPSHLPEPGQVGARVSDHAQIVNILQGASEPGQRQSSVLATLRLPDQAAIPLLRRALLDSEDDVRLLAYALLERKEQAISTRIRLMEERLSHAEPGQSFSLHKSISQDCWEFIHLGLAQGEVLRHLLIKAREHAEDALQLSPHDASLQFLLGRILLRQREYELASAAFGHAIQSGIDSAKVRPYLAEIEFSRRRFTDVSEQLEKVEASVSGQLLGAPVVYWQRHG